jgi:hypothetical protein
VADIWHQSEAIIRDIGRLVDLVRHLVAECGRLRQSRGALLMRPMPRFISTDASASMARTSSGGSGAVIS